MSAAAAVVNDASAMAEARATAEAELQATAAGMGADEMILTPAFFINQFYNKLIRHAFMPELARFDNTAKLLSFCEADYAAVQKLLALIGPAVAAEQQASGDKLSASNSARAEDLVAAGYIHLSFFRFQDTTLFTEEEQDDGEVCTVAVRCIIVRASVVASMNSTHYVTRILFTQAAGTAKWRATQDLKNCQCVSGSELQHLWCTHMAGVFIALAKLVRNCNRSLTGLKRQWPEDIVLIQAQAVRLSLVVGPRALAIAPLSESTSDGDDSLSDDNTDSDENDGHASPEGGAPVTGPQLRVRRPYRRKMNPSGAKSLTKKAIDKDIAKYINDGLTDLMMRRHISTLRHAREGDIFPTDSRLNFTRQYRPVEE